MSMTADLHYAINSHVDVYEFDGSCPAFCSIKARDDNGNQIIIYIDKTPDSLRFLDQLRHSVDLAIKWARAD